ncbi:MAG: S-layer homology domain-containing protein [Thermoleophilia bacterium]|jgi:hypothetical protein
MRWFKRMVLATILPLTALALTFASAQSTQASPTQAPPIVPRSCVDVPAPMASDGQLFRLESVGSDGHTVFRTASTRNFSDVGSTPYSDSIQAIAGRGIISGFPDGTFRPGAPVTRQQFAKMIAKATGIPVSLKDVCPFPDVAANLDKTDPLYPNHYVGAAAKAGLIQGYPNGTFRPTNSITRAQVVSMVVRAGEKLHPGLLQTPPSTYKSDWGNFDQEHTANVRKAEFNRLLSLANRLQLDPFAPMPRGEVASILNSYLRLIEDHATYAPAKSAAVAALTNALDEGRKSLYVYSDFGMTVNHFTQKAKVFGNNARHVRDMNENWRDMPYAGTSCIRCTQVTRPGDWGGWMFLNGYLPKGETVPRLNDGRAGGQGLDLTGAMELRFFAKGKEGGECVEFFTAGFGYDRENNSALVPYPDSAIKQSLGFIELTKEWQEYVIPLESLNMSSIVCGFGYVLSGDTSGKRTSEFYLDEIRFVSEKFAAANAHVMLRSYETNNVYLRNVAFSYDNALAAMALLSEGKKNEAAYILDAFVYAVENDRHKAGRVRNAYAAGDISAFAGWETGARLPGWYDTKEKQWREDRYQVGSNVGNTSYVALALLQYDAADPTERYLNTARALMDWVIDTCSSDGNGFTAGFNGWAEGKPPTIYPLSYKSIEHNIDAYAAFAQLFERTGEQKYKAARDSTRRFIDSMYDSKDGVFYIGTLADGKTPNKEEIVLDAQVWTALALGDDFEPYERSLDHADAMKVDAGGYSFDKANPGGGWWAEGTAFTALMHRLRGDNTKATAALDALCSIQLDSGLFPAATVKGLYSTDPHIAPAAWFIMAINGFNPYSFLP